MLIKIGKIETVKRQINAALKIWLDEGDDVAIATLVFPACQIIWDLGRMKGEQQCDLMVLIKEAIDERKLPQYLLGIARKPINFIKHADRDPDEILDYETDLAFKFMLHAIECLERLGERRTPLHVAFQIWMATLHSEQISFDGFVQGIYTKTTRPNEIYQDVLKALGKRRAELGGLIAWE